MSHRPSAIAGAALIALALTGCAGGGAPSETTPGADSTLLSTVTDTIYGAVEVPQPDDGELTVVALGWSDAEVALALGVAPVAVYDWQGFGADAKGVGPWATASFGSETPTIIQNVGDALDYETIESLQPDLILNTRSAADEAVYTRLSSIAPTVYAPAGTADYGTSWDVQTAQVAQALGLDSDGAELISSVETTITDAAAAHPEFAGKTAVSGTKFGDAYGAYIAGDFRWDLLEALGFTQNPPVLELEASGFYVPVSAEQVSVFDADIATFFPIGYTLDELLADPLIASLSVVQDERTVFLEAGDEVTAAFSAASPLSIPIAVEGLVPRLSETLAD